MALARLGASPVTNLETDATVESKLCNTLFDIVARRVMVQGSWTTTIARAELAKTTNTPAFGYTYEFQLPTSPKCLKVLETNETAPGSIAFQIEGDKLLTNESAMKIKYISELTDTERYGPNLTEAIEVLLASYLAYPLSGKSTIAESLKREFSDILQRNLVVDGQQGSKALVTADDLIDVR